MPVISPIRRDQALEQAAQEQGVVANDALWAGALSGGIQTQGAGPYGYQPNNTEVTFPTKESLDPFNISDTMLQGEAASTPLPASPKSVLQAEASSTPLPANTKSGSTDPVKVPEYLHGFCIQILKDWNEISPTPMKRVCDHVMVR